MWSLWNIYMMILLSLGCNFLAALLPSWSVLRIMNFRELLQKVRDPFSALSTSPDTGISTFICKFGNERRNHNRNATCATHRVGKVENCAKTRWWFPEFVAPMLSSVSAPCLALPGFIIASSFREGRGNDEPIRAAIDSWNKKTTKSTLSRWDARSFFKSQVTFECRISTFSRRYPLDPLKTWRKCQDETLKIRKEEKRGGLA